MSHAALSLGKFYARRIENRHVHTLARRYGHLGYGENHRRVLNCIEEVLHAT
jgi:hypothetical protein